MYQAFIRKIELVPNDNDILRADIDVEYVNGADSVTKSYSYVSKADYLAQFKETVLMELERVNTMLAAKAAIEGLLNTEVEV